MEPSGSHCLREQKKTVEGVGETAAEAMKRDCNILVCDTQAGMESGNRTHFHKFTRYIVLPCRRTNLDGSGFHQRAKK